MLIPQVEEKFRGIGILDSVWKLCSSFINKRINEKLNFTSLFMGLEETEEQGRLFLRPHYILANLRKMTKLFFKPS